MIETGVYSILNIKNGKEYIGGAYRSFSKRWRDHKNQLRRGTHHNRHLQAAWNKYGEAWFVFDIIERCGPNSKEISDRETYLQWGRYAVDLEGVQAELGRIPRCDVSDYDFAFHNHLKDYCHPCNLRLRLRELSWLVEGRAV